MTPKSFVRIKTRHDILNIYKPIFFVLMIFGYNYEGFKRFGLNVLMKAYSCLLVVLVTYSTFSCCRDVLTLVWSLLEYVIFVGVLIFYRSNIKLYYERVLQLDSYLRVNSRYYFKSRTRMILMFAFISTIRVSHTFVYCYYLNCYHIISYWFVAYGICLLALDMNRVWRYCMYEELWRRIRLLRKRIEESPENNFYLYVKDNKAMKENKVRFCFNMYRDVDDIVHLIVPELNASLMISIVCSLPKLILNLYFILLVIDHRMPLSSLGSMFIHLSHTTLFIFAPCVVADFYYAEVEKIRMFLMHLLINEIDPSTKEDIKLFLRYTYMRPLRHTVWRCIPVDLSLPLALMNFCSTYVIVVLNFTKVFND